MITNTRYRYGWFIGASLLVLGVEWLVALTRGASVSSALALGITLDLVLGLPALYYWLVLRHSQRSRHALVPVALLALLSARIIVPSSGQGLLTLLEWVAIGLELLLLGTLLVRIRRIWRTYQQLRPTYAYASDALSTSVRTHVGAAPRWLLQELLLLWGGLWGWTRGFQPQPQHVAFSYHRRSGYTALLGLFIFLVLVETGLVHLLVQHWSPTAAWILSGLSLYTLLWLWGDYQLIRLHPLVLTPTTLHLRSGLRWRADVPRSAVQSLRRASGRERNQLFSIALVGPPQHIVEFTQPITVTNLFGRQRQVTQLGLTIDDPAALIDALSSVG